MTSRESWLNALRAKKERDFILFCLRFIELRRDFGTQSVMDAPPWKRSTVSCAFFLCCLSIPFDSVFLHCSG